MQRFAFPAMLALVLLSALNLAALAQSGQRRSASRNAIFTHPSIEQAWESAVAENKTLLVMFKTDHCHYCTKMLSETYNHPAIQRMLAKDTESVLANAEDYQALTKKMGIRGYPTTLLISPQGEVLDLLEGFVDAKTFAKRVNPLLAKQAARLGNASAANIQSPTVDR